MAIIADLCGSRNGNIHTQKFFAFDGEQVRSILEKIKLMSPEYIYPGHRERPISKEELMKLEVEVSH